MKVAIAVDQGMVSPHFGRCEGYLLANIREGQIVNQQSIPSPGHEPGRLPQLMHELGVECLIVGGMGPRAQQLLSELGIAVMSGVSGDVREVLAQFAAGQLQEGENVCEH